MSVPFTRTLRFKVRPESYAWLNAAAVEVNGVFNYCNQISFATATRTDRKRKWLSGYDLCNLTAGATEYFQRIGADTIQRICVEYAQKRVAARRLKLRWRVSRGARRSLGWIPFKAASLKRKGTALRFCGKSFRVYERERLEGVSWKQGCFAQDACHQFSRKIINTYRKIVVGDVSSLKLAKTRMAKSVLDSGWGMLKRFLQYKGECAGRTVRVVNERNTSRACSSCGAFSGPSGLRQLAVRLWECAHCGESHDRDVNAARNILMAGSRCGSSVSGNEPSPTGRAPSQTSGLCEAGSHAPRTAA
jgi:IS605 OrfB family transposase